MLAVDAAASRSGASARPAFADLTTACATPFIRLSISFSLDARSRGGSIFELPRRGKPRRGASGSIDRPVASLPPTSCRADDD